jgi:hypothetical protein
LSRGELERLFKFTCVRNPFDQLVSKYIKHCARLMDNPARYPWLEGAQATAPDNSFPQWLVYLSRTYEETDKLAKGPLEFLAHADMVIRFEALQDGFDESLRHMGIKDRLSVTEFNVTKGRADSAEAAVPDAKPAKKKKNYTEFYDTACIAMVERLYEPILKQFNYSFGH